MNKDFLLTTGLLAGTIIGAGIFSLPYVVSRLGILNGFFYLIGFALVYFVVHLMYANLIRVNQGEHQFFYLAKKYLPRGLSDFASFIILAELVFVLTVYLILAPTFAKLVFGEGGLAALFVFWFLGSIFIFAKLSFLDWAEFLGTLSILVIVAIIFFVGGGSRFGTPIFTPMNLPLFFLPFGPMLFSLAGRPAISKVMEKYRQVKAGGKNLSLNKVIFWGTVIPAVVYFLFAVSILRLNPEPSAEALNSLGFLPPAILILLGLLGLLTLWTSYFIIGANIKDILRIDLKKPAWFGAFAVLATPLILYFLGFKNFLPAVSLTGGIFLSLEGIFVITMWRKAFPQNPWRPVVFPLYLVFLAAMVYVIISFIF